MQITKLKTRSVVFTQHLEHWDLNIHLIMGKKNNFLIDTGLGSKSMLPVIDYLKDSDLPLIIIISHHHWDHIWGNHMFPKATIISHSLCRDIIESKWNEMMEKHGELVAGETEKVLPNLVFNDSLYFPDDKIRLFYTPGHTIDCISVHDEMDEVLNAGDNIGDNSEEIVPYLNADKSLYLETLDKYQELEFDTCISGHNSTQSKDIIERIRKEVLAQ